MAGEGRADQLEREEVNQQQCEYSPCLASLIDIRIASAQFRVLLVYLVRAY